jgi:hypothetical protein
MHLAGSELPSTVGTQSQNCPWQGGVRVMKWAERCATEPACTWITHIILFCTVLASVWCVWYDCHPTWVSTVVSTYTISRYNIHCIVHRFLNMLCMVYFWCYYCRLHGYTEVNALLRTESTLQSPQLKHDRSSNGSCAHICRVRVLGSIAFYSSMYWDVAEEFLPF